MQSGVVWRAVLGAVILAAAVAFVLFGFDPVQVDERGDPVQDVTPRPAVTAVLEEQPAENQSESLELIETTCRELFYAEPQCAQVVADLCAEAGTEDPQCVDARAAFCATRPATPVCATP